MSRKTDTLLAFISGATVGAVAGILFAPDKGRETRDKLSYKLEKYRDMLADLTDQLMDSRNATPSAAKTEGQKVIQDAKAKAEKLLGDVDSLIKQINSQKDL